MTKLSIRYLALAAIPLFALAACSSNDSPAGGSGGSSGSGGASGSGGSSGSGGASGSGGSSGSGGASGSGGSSGSGGAGVDAASGTGGAGTGGASGTGGAVATDGGLNPDAPATCLAASAVSPLISDFATGTTAVSMQANGGTDVWVVTPGGTATIAGGEMHGVTTAGNYASASTVIGKGLCVDVSKYTGVKFKIKSATNTMLLFGVTTPETAVDYSNFHSPVAVTTAYTEVSVPFATLGKPTFGAGLALPASYKPATRMTAISLGIVGATPATITEKLDIFLDDVTFY